METLRTATEWFRVDSENTAGSVRRAAVRLADKLGFDESRAAETGLVASEMTSNVWRHADDGVVAVQIALRSADPGIRIVAIDRGPGRADTRLSATDGHSTRGTLGLGLGAIARMSSSFEVSSQPGHGTVLVAELWSHPGAVPDVDVGGLTRPIEGEEVCGDVIGAREAHGRQLLMLSDGLGHGPLAADASIAALAVFHETASPDPAAVLAAMDARLSRTRGAAAAVACIDPSFSRLTFAGIGNVSAFVDDGNRRHAAVSQPGIVGHGAAAAHVVELELPAGAVVVLHSDGLRERWNLRDVPGLGRRSATVIAATLLRDVGNRPDDASVLVVRRRP